MSHKLLLVDMGNSRLKWAWGANGVITHGGAFPSTLVALPDNLEVSWRTAEPPDVVYVSNVLGAAAAEKLQVWVDSNWHVPVRFARSEAFSHGVVNGYAQPELLGVDRWLALLGARREIGGPVCVVDCGTALTLDFMDGEGRHQGGLIVPGLLAMTDSLCSATHGVRVGAAAASPVSWPGRDTLTCVEAGAVLACSGLIEKCAREWARQQGEDVCVVLAGGDAIRIGDQLALPWRLDEFLVMRGLLTLAEHQT